MNTKDTIGSHRKEKEGQNEADQRGENCGESIFLGENTRTNLSDTESPNSDKYDNNPSDEFVVDDNCDRIVENCIDIDFSGICLEVNLYIVGRSVKQHWEQHY